MNKKLIVLSHISSPNRVLFSNHYYAYLGTPHYLLIKLFLDGKIAADRGAMVIVKTKRINPDIKILAVADDESEKTRVLGYGADGFTTKPVSVETIADKVSALLMVGKNVG